MRCEDFPACDHGSPLVCLTARAAETPESELSIWLTEKELATHEIVTALVPESVLMVLITTDWADLTPELAERIIRGLS